MWLQPTGNWIRAALNNEYLYEFKFYLLLFESVFLSRYLLKKSLKFQNTYATGEIIEAIIYCGLEVRKDIIKLWFSNRGLFGLHHSLIYQCLYALFIPFFATWCIILNIVEYILWGVGRMRAALGI